ncbi:MAG: DegT/DnrJ/EryC1/StrS family aminotransferase [Armatimonadota bacterium]
MRLAVKGGEPVRTRPWPAWPVGDEEEKQALSRVVDSGLWGIGSPEITALEQELADFCGVRHAVCTANGTVSLMIALKAIGVGAGDEVIVPPYTFLATAMAVVLVNAVPVFADIDPDTYCIDLSAVERAISPRTKAVIPVHLGGHPADMDRLCDLADRYGIRVIEDAAQAHGAEWNGRRVGSIGHLGSFSFQSSKNVSGGEGGAVVTNDEELYQAVWSYHNCGRVMTGRWYDHYFAAANYRLSAWQAAVIRVQLRRLQELNAKRMESAAYLDRRLSEIPGIRPLVRRPEATAHAYHLYIIRYDSEGFCGVSREVFVKALNAEGIPASTGYTPLYKLPAFSNPDVLRCPLGCPLYAGERPRYCEMELPVAERACTTEGVWLFHNLLLGEKRDLDDIVDAVAKIHEHASELVDL